MPSDRPPALKYIFAYPQKFLADFLIWSVVTPLAFLLRFDFAVPPEYVTAAVWFTFFSLLAKAILIPAFGLNLQSWRHVSLTDVIRLGFAIATMLALQYLYIFLVGPGLNVPRSIPLIEFTMSVLAMVGMRTLWRIRYRRSLLKNPVEGRRVLVIGAGEAGAMVVREMRRHPELGLHPIGFLDDGVEKRRLRIENVGVLGPISYLPLVLEREAVDEVILAIPTGDGDIVRVVRSQTTEADVSLRIMPGVFELLNDNVSVSRLREVRIEDLLRREAVPVDLTAVRGYLAGKTVLVTGAGGSIGSELVRQVARCGAKRVIALGRGENSLYALLEGLQDEGVTADIVPVITDVRDTASLEHVFEQHKPQVVFHAAAHKHVPLMEQNPDQAVLNNVGGTQNVADAAIRHGVERFVNISTDKAVNPTSVMGATKRLAEQVVSTAAGGTRNFVSVRFGNVLGSRGSVVPRFKRQIESGGPVQVTHKDMTRFFMTIPEAVQLVLQAGAMAAPGAVYFLDMGEPVRITQLAEDLIQLSGLKPHEDIKIEFTGIRDGEKLYEELVLDGEEATPTRHPQVFLTSNGRSAVRIEAVLAAAKKGDAKAIRTALASEVELKYEHEAQTA